MFNIHFCIVFVLVSGTSISAIIRRNFNWNQYKGFRSVFNGPLFDNQDIPLALNFESTLKKSRESTDRIFPSLAMLFGGFQTSNNKLLWSYCKNDLLQKHCKHIIGLITTGDTCFWQNNLNVRNKTKPRYV